MTPSRSSILAIIKNAATEDELRESVVYVVPEIGAGDEVVINRKNTKVDSPSCLIFIDLEPKANWSHPCKYVLINADGTVQSTTEGQYPPGAEKLELFSKPADVEDWVLLADKKFTG